jgi:hypothetical protein
MGETRNVYKILVRIPEGKRPLGRRRSIWEDNVKIYIKQIGRGEGADWIHPGQQRGLWWELHNEPSGSMKGGKFIDQLSDY